MARPTRPVWAWVRLLAGLGILGLLLWRVGTGPFLQGVRAVDAMALLAALALGAVITVGCAWRWSLIAAGLGVRLSLPTAMAAYYRSQFLNTTTPGGILGEVDRAARHGSNIGDLGLGVRAVVLDRVAGQVAQIGIAGWKPHEGMAAWAFAVSGLPATWGVATAATFGVLVLAASLPGFGVLMYTWVKQSRHIGRPPTSARVARANGREVFHGGDR